MKNCETVERMIRKSLYKSQGKFRFALINGENHARITSRTIPVSIVTFITTFDLGDSIPCPLSNVQIKYHTGVGWCPPEIGDEGIP